ncbi:gluconate 2-dehydrogenase subunit 3 family protein [Planococcus soli]|uniref:gluconate 2-dehydrogenase subunit 3 family protein n=1 Tax=Planococcus soli TaxID=2666072 RepID=UPI00115D6AD0|nr:gluconate 2-dehydrogenase subunit 3 family protein [Planococcus soli]
MADNNTQAGKKGTTRRDFLKNSGLTVGGVVLGGAIGSLFGVNNTTTTQETAPAAPALTVNPAAALMFFTPDQYQLTQAAAERIYPKDDNGPGAMELNAAIYIDHQLAGAWGINSKEYMAGPFYKAEETQGSQIRILRKDLFTMGLAALNTHSNKTFQANFVDLEAEQQDEILTAFSEDKAPEISKVRSSIFFSLLRTLTIEGVYADPLYGGNKDMQGWAMRKYPGTRLSFAQEIQNSDFVQLDPESLTSHMGH